ncbi:MAG: hypothetical protein WCG67_05235 [Ferruginibacter sp.]
MKKILIVIIVFFTLLIYTNTNAQYGKVGKSEANAPAKAVYFELGGPGVAALNYDMRFTKSESGIGGRIGIGGFSIGSGSNKATAIFIPLGLNYLLGKDSRNYFELGAGASIVSLKEGTTSSNLGATFGYLNFGYRLQPKDGGYFFRAAINPIFGKGFFVPYYAGIAFGYKF